MKNTKYHIYIMMTVGDDQPLMNCTVMIIPFREPLIIQCRAEVRKIYSRMLSKLRRNTDVFQGDLARLCREDSVLMRGREILEVP